MSLRRMLFIAAMFTLGSYVGISFERTYITPMICASHAPTHVAPTRVSINTWTGYAINSAKK